jgi:hypothetical protein
VGVESDDRSPGNPRMYELFADAPTGGTGATVWSFPQFVEFLKVAGQPVQGPWPPHQEPRPDPSAVEAGPVAVADPGSTSRTGDRTGDRTGERTGER